MKNTFSYSVLQYKHSLAVGEVINTAVLFYFPEIRRLYFKADSPSRLKAIYPNFDSHSFTEIIKGIEKAISDQDDLFTREELGKDLQQTVGKSILREDSTALQFDKTAQVVNVFKSPEQALQQYSEILLPGLKHAKVSVSLRNTEKQIVSRYLDLVGKKNESLIHRIQKDARIETTEIQLKFELAWQNGSTNYVKPLSFDLVDDHSIQSKSATYFGYLTLLNDFALKNNARFHLLVSRPNNPDLISAYQKAIEVLQRADSPKRIISEDELKDYSQETVEQLSRSLEG